MSVDLEKLSKDMKTGYTYYKWYIQYRTRSGLEFKFEVIATTEEDAHRLAHVVILRRYSTYPEILTFSKDESFSTVKLGKAQARWNSIGSEDLRLNRFEKVFD